MLVSASRLGFWVLVSCLVVLQRHSYIHQLSYNNQKDPPCLQQFQSRGADINNYPFYNFLTSYILFLNNKVVYMVLQKVRQHCSPWVYSQDFSQPHTAILALESLSLLLAFPLGELAYLSQWLQERCSVTPLSLQQPSLPHHECDTNIGTPEYSYNHSLHDLSCFIAIMYLLRDSLYSRTAKTYCSRNGSSSNRCRRTGDR